MKNLIPKELAIKLKKIGFDEPCIAEFRGMDIQPVCQLDVDFKYSKNSEISTETHYWLSAPTYEQVKMWFLEKHSILITVRRGDIFLKQYFSEVEAESWIWKSVFEYDYYEAFIHGINEAIHHLKTFNELQNNENSKEI